jgi:hypothetical protein
MSEYVIMDFNSNDLPDAAWAATQPVGSRLFIIEGKGDSGLDTYSIAQGQGRNGTNALRITCNQITYNGQLANNLPGFFLKVGNVQRGGVFANYKNDQGYLIPRGTKANRLHIWMKFPPGFRANNIAQIQSGSTYDNLQIGTYHVDPGKITGSSDVKETDNFHMYYQVVIRHDLADNEWVHVVVGDRPSHQRGNSGADIPVNMTQSCGDFIHLFTRLYFDCTPYRANPEIAYPYDILVDSIYTTYEEPPHDIDVYFPSLGNGQDFYCRPLETYNFPFCVTNNGASAVTGKLSLRSRYGLNPKILDPVTSASVDGATITVQPGETKTYTYQINPRGNTTLRSGVSFFPNDMIPAANGRLVANFTDPNLCVNTALKYISPADGWGYGAHFRADAKDTTVAPTLPTNRAWSNGGAVFEAPVDAPYSGVLQGKSFYNQPLTFKKLDQQSTGGNIVISADGSFTFTPTTGYRGSFFFRYSVEDTANAATPMSYGSWIYVSDGVSPPTPPDPPPTPTSIKLFQANGKLLVSDAGKPLGYGA